jgi:predicted house-cleaning noncanonical NTP pyrophosphatase (MazG superfamily)
MIKYQKLVRDKIPEIIQNSGKTPKTHIADDKEYTIKLRDKLDEEVAEFKESGQQEELADILEVIDAICVFNGIDRKNLQKIKKEKTKDRGSFSKRIILEDIK